MGCTSWTDLSRVAYRTLGRVRVRVALNFGSHRGQAAADARAENLEPRPMIVASRWSLMDEPCRRVAVLLLLSAI
eukprot:scaffold466580_cov39-Prasinocladus_malaysianus.AAC.1